MSPHPPQTPGNTAPVDPLPFIKRVGRGRTLSGSLDRAEARTAFSSLLAGGFTDAQAGAFLQALRIKELTPDELEGLMDAFQADPAHAPALASEGTGGFTLNLASDTPRKGGYASLLAASMLAAEGVAVGVVRSDPMLSRNTGAWDETQSLMGAGRAPFSGPLPVAEAHDAVPGLAALRRVRSELGFRSCLHTAEKLLNPWPGKPIVLGISHAHYAERMANYLKGRGLSGKIVLGNHGTPDLVLHKHTEIWEVDEAGIRVLRLDPAQFGLEPDASVYSLGFFPRWKEELALPGFGKLGPVLNYHMAFLRYAAGLTPRPVESVLSAGGAA